VLLAHTAICILFLPDDAGRGWQYGLQGGAKEWMPRFNPVGFFAIFALGALAAGVETRLPARRSFSFDAAAALALAVAGTRIAISPGGSWEGYGWLGIPYAFPVFPLAIAAALVCLAHSRLLAALLDNAPVRYVARISFGIYVWQEIVLLTMKELDPASFGAAETDVLAGWISSCGIAAVLITMVASLSYYLLEKPVLQSTARLASINGR
jgi:peptidoglycan/LPS O-acetylase OafA/YrhL